MRKTLDVRFIKSRIPAIIFYFAVSLIVAKGIDYGLYKYVLPDTYFVRNYSMTVFSATEHTDVPVRVCRDRRGDRIGSGEREIYIIPPGGTEKDAKLAGQYELKNIIVNGDRCDQFTIKVGQFDHSAGTYQALTKLNLEGKYGRQINVSFKSNIYKILPATAEDIQQRLKELQEQIKRLEQQQQAVAPKNSSDSSTPQTPRASTPSSGGSTPPAQSGTDNPVATKPDPVTPTPEEPEDKPIGILPTICIPLTNVCVNKQ